MGKGGVSTTALVSALRGILEPTVTSAPREWLGMDAQRRVAGKRAPTVVDVSQTVAVSVWRVGVVRIARDARRATLEITVKRNATRTRRVEVTDVAGQTVFVCALRHGQARLARFAQRHHRRVSLQNHRRCWACTGECARRDACGMKLATVEDDAAGMAYANAR